MLEWRRLAANRKVCRMAASIPNIAPVVHFTPSRSRYQFITRDSMYAIARLCHANSVCPSVTRVYCIKTAERIIEILSRSDRPIILVFCHQVSLGNSEGVTPNGDAKYKGVAIFDQYATISRKR